VVAGEMMMMIGILKILRNLRTPRILLQQKAILKINLAQIVMKELITIHLI